MWYTESMTVSEQLRRAIERCGMTRAELARRSGVAESVLSRFVVGGHNLKTPNLDAVCEALGLVLTAKAGKARKGR
jgi:transcriptional regulator with XRE-family HTH domain